MINMLFYDDDVYVYYVNNISNKQKFIKILFNQKNSNFEIFNNFLINKNVDNSKDYKK
jgi:hypothetical protein